MKKLSLITALLSSCVALNANAYQTEATGAYEYVDMDGGKTNSAAISGKYYFNPVQTRNAPLAEAAFLDKASSIGGGYAYSKLQDDEDFGDLQFNIIGVEGEVFIPDTQFYVSGALHRTNIKATINGLGSESDNGNGYEFEAGFLPVNGLLLAVGVADFSESINPVKVAKYGFVTNVSNAAVVSGDNDDTAVSLRAKYVSEVAGFYTNFEGVTYIGDETSYRLAADLYLDQTLSVGVSFADSTADDSDSIFNIRAQKFFNPQFALGVGYTTTDGADSYGINGTFRF
ncbi:putative porin [Acinetobacter venetianus]|uniref:putative porin n=1 Tax=Acinetobacter venetianus TaxID=52133 RepID=UPI0010A5ABD9|nr:putative porin [Acinetobacter venetianus]MCR4529577.1 putative porin [Acinetobacter venetianus]MDA0695163.1 putative porin [Pseudomonadota bacterium]MDA1253135.1 putative porin [Pseudomonadota bacterium]